MNWIELNYKKEEVFEFCVWYVMYGFENKTGAEEWLTREEFIGIFFSFFLKLTGHQSFIALLTNTNNNKVNNILYVYIYI